MKSTLIFLWIVSTILFRQGGSAQSFKIYSSYKSTGTMWDSVGISTRIQGFTVSNDAINGTDTLFIAINNDTARTRIVPVLCGEVVRFNGLQARFIRTKASANSILRRIIAY